MALTSKSKPTFPKLTLKSSVEFDSGRREIYVLCITGTNKDLDGTIAASGSNNCINVYTNRGSGLEVAYQIEASGRGEGVVSGLEWADRQLCASSTDGHVRLWDTRKSSKTPTSTFQGYNHEPFNCVSSDMSGSLIAAGSDLVGEDAAIYIWDLRMGRDPIGQFTESHSDDIVAVQFKPDSTYSLASGSTDGLVCLFDLHTMEEEEAVISVKNSEASVCKVGFCGLNHLYCLTHEGGCVVWENAEVEPLYTDRNVKNTIQDEFGVDIDYLVDYHYQSSSDELFLVGGDNSGGVRVLHCEDMKSPKPVGLFIGGHTATVRALYWDSTVDGETLVTGGEDGLVCLWTL
ncbi:WD repeat-containing protein 89-like isoform X2 [Halichondria panicea]|uniref:WD repeat-containing protein 89-like isoform X2 n=1 Tax=Halichondria panicea TaxID=6063 RepID=UPI00312B47A8